MLQKYIAFSNFSKIARIIKQLGNKHPLLFSFVVHFSRLKLNK